MIVTYLQCRAARELLQWSRSDVEKKAGISRSTLADFERGTRNLTIDSFKKILSTFEKAGIEFINDEKGKGVRLNKKQK